MRRVVASALATVLAATGIGLVAAPAQAAGTAVVLNVSQSRIKHGEMVWFTGKVTVGGKAASRSLALERRSGSRWVRVASSTSSSSGTFTVRQRPAKEYTYRVRAVASGAASRARTIDFTAGARTMASRTSALGSRLGAPTTAVRAATVSGKKSVRYRSFTKGMLVQVVNPSGSMRTWFVYGDILAAYRKAGGPTGKLGVPVADPKCGLIESGCVQRFTGGSVYDNKNTKPAVAYGSGLKTEIIAAARSQVGYVQKSFNRSKYNAWSGRVGAWCSVFQSWAAAASGNPGVIPQHDRWASFLADVKRNEKLGKTPKVGALVFFDTIADGRTEATHVGIVVQVKSSTIVTIEGNTSTPGSATTRGVYQKERARSFPLFYAYPNY